MANVGNRAIKKVSHEEALEACVEVHSLSGYLEFGPIKLNLVGWAVCFFVVAARLVVLFFDVPSFLTMSIDAGIILSIYWGLSPTFEPIRIRYMLYVQAVFNDENQVKAAKNKQYRNFYGN